MTRSTDRTTRRQGRGDVRRRQRDAGRRRPSATGALAARCARCSPAARWRSRSPARRRRVRAGAGPAPVKVLAVPRPARTRPRSPASTRFEAIGAGHGFTVDATGDAAHDHGRGPRRRTAPSSSSTPPATCSTTSRRARCEAFIEDGGGFLGIGSAAQSELGHRVLRRADRRAPERGRARPTPSEQTRRRRRPGAPGDARTSPLESDRTDVWYQWQTRPTGHGPHRRALPRDERARRRRHRRRRHRPPDLVVPRLRGRPLLLHRHGPHRRQLRRGGLPHHLLRRGPVDGRPRARQLQGDDQQQLQGHEDRRPPAPRSSASRNTGESHGLVTAPNGWVLYIGRGDCRTDAERGDAARRCRRSGASSTTPTRTSASAAAASTSGIPRRPTARSTAA